MLGADFAALSDEERLARIDDIGVVGRVAPEHKVLLVQTLRKKGDVVAMAGDGVNDAPAIKTADIGIAMGTGTQVAKNASRMILSDDNYATIVVAVRGGRKVYDNLNKFIRFVIVELVAYIITFLGASILNIAAGQPFSPCRSCTSTSSSTRRSACWLGMDKEAPGLMNLKPRSRDESIMTRGLLTTAGLVGLFMAACTLALISYGTTHYDNVLIGTSMGVTTFSLMLIAAVFQARSVTGTALTTESFDNRHLNITALIELLLAVLITQMDVMRVLLGTVQLSLTQWSLALAPAVALFFLWELGKLIARRKTAVAHEPPPPSRQPPADDRGRPDRTASFITPGVTRVHNAEAARLTIGCAGPWDRWIEAKRTDGPALAQPHELRLRPRRREHRRGAVTGGRDRAQPGRRRGAPCRPVPPVGPLLRATRWCRGSRSRPVRRRWRPGSRRASPPRT